ncbi:MAG: GTP cyclohydrolase I FolE [Candidatus Diapherotrites archaeon]|nr:GTP cyclohydrolase I FolE [Candidatus Diapherotrites archaeon]
MNKKDIERILINIGENPQRAGLKKTPERFLETWKFLTSGYSLEIKKLVNGAVYTAEDNNMIVIKDIDFFSLCEHHLLPFFGKMHIGYIPRKKIIGLSKSPRMVEMFSRRLQVQERLIPQVANAIESAIKPDGVAVVADAIHTCMAMRGVQKVNSKTITSCMLGAFKKNPATRNEFLQLIMAK